MAGRLHLRQLGLLRGGESPLFEVGGVTRRELLQALRLALPEADGVSVPLGRQGRGAQRLLLVSVLLRLASVGGRAPIAGIEEPEEALEPLRQAQLSQMLRSVAERGGQVFVVTHSTEVARAFEIDDFVLLQERTAGEGARVLRDHLSPPVCQAYERRLDGAVVRGLFARIPVLVEGPGDRAVFEHFWARMARDGEIPFPHELGLDVVNAEGVGNMSMLSAVLDAAGKAVVVWADRDRPEVDRDLTRLRHENKHRALVLHAPGRPNLERSLAYGARLDSLAKAMSALAADRGYSWEDQRADLVSRSEGVDPDRREAAKAATSLDAFLQTLGDEHARRVIASALEAKGVRPFEMKGARQARVVATAIVEAQGVPEPFASMMSALSRWITEGCRRGTEIPMPGA